MRTRSPACSPDLSRRGFLSAAYGLAAHTLLNVPGARGQEVDRVRKQAHNVVLVVCTGGMSQLDSWDPKELLKQKGEIGGPFKIGLTKSRDALITEPFAALGAIDDEYMLMRGMHASSDVHDKAMGEWLRTGRERTHLFATLAGNARGGIPGVDLITPGVEVPDFVRARKDEVASHGASILEMRWDEYKKDCVTAARFDKPPSHDSRMGLLQQLDARGPVGRGPEQYLEHRRTADTIVQKGITDAFTDPNPKVREARKKLYGDNAYGRIFDIAGRLADPQHGNVPLVVVETGHWDVHGDLEKDMSDRGPKFSQALAGLIHDYRDRVVIAVRGEFGHYDKDGGRPLAQFDTFGRKHFLIHSGIMAGPTVKTGIYGSTSKDGRNIASGRMTNDDFTRMLLQACGLEQRTFDNEVVNAILRA